MADIKKTKSEALAIINAALTILDKFPDLSETDINLSYGVSLNPFSFLMDAFKNTAGYDALIRILSNYIAYGIDALEITVKGILLSNMKNLISCSINPFISDDLLRDGIVFDLRRIDITNILDTCPLDTKIGQYFYFGCDGMEITDEVKDSEDFNALLWYMKNKALNREVWGKTEEVVSDEKLTKSNGILTLEYNESVLSLKDAEGDAMFIQTPYRNCLHVFIGNVQTTTNVEAYESLLSDYSTQAKEITDKIEDYESDILAIDEEITELDEEYKAQTINSITYNTTYNDLEDERADIESAIKEEETNLEEVYKKKQEVLIEYKEAISDFGYRSIKANYYYRKTLIEFNYDYIMSLKLFDSKVIAAQLIDALTGMLTIDLSLSYSQQLIKYETQKIVQSIIETDDAVVSDCYFTFSNDDYNEMLEKSETVRSGLYTINGEQNSAVKVDAESLLNSLNGLTNGATKQEIQTVIEGSITDISKTLSNVDYTQSNKVNFGIQMNFIENLMTNLAYVITLSILSPKVYLLILINLKTMGQETNYDLNDFIAMFKKLITQLIRAVRDALIQYLVTELMKLLQDLASNVATKIVIEQSLYYARLIKRLIECLKGSKTIYDWQVDNVDYADIVESEDEPETTEC